MLLPKRKRLREGAVIDEFGAGSRSRTWPFPGAKSLKGYALPPYRQRYPLSCFITAAHADASRGS